MGKSAHVSIRLSKDEIARIDALIEDASPWWRKATRSDVLRMLVLTSLARIDQGESLTPNPVTPTLYLSANKPNRRRVK